MPYRNGEFLPVGSLSAFNRSSVRSIAVALKIFLDGSGQSEDASNQFLTLASIMASDDSWSTFEAAWSAALNRHGVPYSHMKELLRGEGPFHDWEDRAKIAFVKDLFNVMARMDRGDFLGPLSPSI